MAVIPEDSVLDRWLQSQLSLADRVDVRSGRIGQDRGWLDVLA